MKTVRAEYGTPAVRCITRLFFDYYHGGWSRCRLLFGLIPAVSESESGQTSGFRRARAFSPSQRPLQFINALGH